MSYFSSEPAAAATSLARRVQLHRERLDMTPLQLARKAALPLETIQDIEAGLDLFLSAAVRQKLARALRIRASELEALEKRPEPDPDDPQTVLDAAERLRLLCRKLTYFPEAGHRCPHCETILTVRVFERRDLEDNRIEVIKAHCNHCLFRIEVE